MKKKKGNNEEDMEIVGNGERDGSTHHLGLVGCSLQVEIGVTDPGPVLLFIPARPTPGVT